MKHNTTTIRISQLNKTLLRNYVMENLKEKNPSITNITDDTIITYLIQQDTGLFYNKIKAEAENELNNPKFKYDIR